MSGYIRKNDVLKLLKIAYNWASFAYDSIQKIPSADVAPVRHGEWSWRTGNCYKCTACYALTNVEQCMGEPIYKYCPNCGARMDGKEPDND